MDRLYSRLALLVLLGTLLTAGASCASETESGSWETLLPEPRESTVEPLGTPEQTVFITEEGRVTLWRESGVSEIDLPFEEGERPVHYRRVQNFPGGGTVLQGYDSKLQPSLWWLSGVDSPERASRLNEAVYKGKGEVPPSLGSVSVAAGTESSGPSFTELNLTRQSGEFSGWLEFDNGTEVSGGFFWQTYSGLSGNIPGYTWRPVPRSSFEELALTGFSDLELRRIPGAPEDLPESVTFTGDGGHIASVRSLGRTDEWMLFLEQVSRGPQYLTGYHRGELSFREELETSVLAVPETGYSANQYNRYSLLHRLSEDGTLELLFLIDRGTEPAELAVLRAAPEGANVELTTQAVELEGLSEAFRLRKDRHGQIHLLGLTGDGGLVGSALQLPEPPTADEVEFGEVRPYRLSSYEEDSNSTDSGAGDDLPHLMHGGQQQIIRRDGELVETGLIGELSRRYPAGESGDPADSHPWLAAKLVGDATGPELEILQRGYWPVPGTGGGLLRAGPADKPVPLIDQRNFLLRDGESDEVIAGDPTEREQPRFYSTWPLVLTSAGRIFLINPESGEYSTLMAEEVRLDEWLPESTAGAPSGRGERQSGDSSQ